MPEADVDITPDLVRGLLRTQHPDLADLPLAPFGNGWDNELMRLGDDLLVRLPRRAIAAESIGHECRWLPVIAQCCALPRELPIPVPVRQGVPDDQYPYEWCIVRYLPGEPVGQGTLDATAARTLGAFVRALHVPADPAAPRNAYRGVPLVQRDARMRELLALLGDRVDTARVRAEWDRCLAAPVWDGPPQWLHGDLHPLNVLWNGHSLRAVIDFGDLCGGDPAVDLAIAYMCFDPREREIFLDASGADAATAERGRGWAMALAVAVMASDDAVIAKVGERTLVAALA